MPTVLVCENTTTATRRKFIVTDDKALAKLQAAAVAIRDGNQRISEGTKAVEIGKEAIANWLRDNRECDLSKLEIGSLVTVENVALIEVAKQDRFDAKAFAIEHVALFAAFVKRFPMVKFKALV
jgi:hypothetical protein